MELIKQCPKCGSGDVGWCNISVRPYCRECNYWAPVNMGTKEDAIKKWNAAVEMMEEFRGQAAKVKIYEQVDEEIKFGNAVYHVVGRHRDWNPLPGHTPPEGTLWELTTEFIQHDGVKATAVGAGGTKDEAIRQLSFMIGFKTALDIMGRKLGSP